MGSSLLALFVAPGFGGQLGFWTILIAHIMFCLSFVVVTVKARLTGMDSRLEQAAMDLYANEWQTFWRVTFPLVFPGILGAALLAFSLSFDDFIITNLNAGTEVTFPMFVWGSAQRSHPDADQRGRHRDVRDRGAHRASVVEVSRRRSAASARRMTAALDDRVRTRPGRCAADAVLAGRPAPAGRRWPRSPRTPRADLVVVGGGYTGLWTALRAKERDPGRDVVLLEAARCGEAASGRNGGFAEPSLTHGFANGTVALARRDADAAAAWAARTSTASSTRSRGTASTAGWSAPVSWRWRPASTRWPGWPRRPSRCRRPGSPVRMLDAEADPGPGRLADLPGRPVRPRGGDGRAGAARRGGCGRRASTSACASTSSRRSCPWRATAPASRVPHGAGARSVPRRVVLGTNASRPLLRRLRLMCVPVHDYTVVTEPLERTSSGPPSAGPAARASATRATCSTTTG